MLIADKAFDADRRVIQTLTAAGKTLVIPSKANRRSSRDYDRDLNKARRLIENFFAKLKQFRAITSRYDKTARNFLGAIHLAASAIWLNWRQALARVGPAPQTTARSFWAAISGSAVGGHGGARVNGSIG